MKRLFLLSFLSLFLFCACNNNSTEIPASENEVDAARNFIRSALDGDYDKAKNYMLADSLNSQLLITFQENYQKNMTKEDKRGYRESSIRMPEVRKINDSASIVFYSNSYKNKSDSLMVVRQNGQWLVDFKYSFSSKESIEK